MAAGRGVDIESLIFAKMIPLFFAPLLVTVFKSLEGKASYALAMPELGRKV